MSSACCGSENVPTISEANSSQNYMAPIQFAKDQVPLKIDSTWQGYQDSILANLGDDQLLMVRANSFEDEADAESLGMSRAKEVMKTLGLEESRVILNSDMVSEKFDSSIALVHIEIVDKEKDPAEDQNESAIAESVSNTKVAEPANEKAYAENEVQSKERRNVQSEERREIQSDESGGSLYNGKVQIKGSKTLIYFDENSTSELKDGEVKAYLNTIARKLSNNLKRVYITGHTDNEGSEAFNYNLGLKRAELLEGYLIRLGISPQRINTYSKGEKAPIESNDSEAGRQSNRRIELRIVN